MGHDRNSAKIKAKEQKAPKQSKRAWRNDCKRRKEAADAQKKAKRTGQVTVATVATARLRNSDGRRRHW